MSDGTAIADQTADKAAAATADPTKQMIDILGGMWVGRCLGVAAELGVADVIGDGRKTTEEIAAAVKAHAPSLFRLMRALASAGVFREEGHGVWMNTPVSGLLRATVPGSMRAAAIVTMSGEHYTAWAALDHSVRSGETAADHVLGKDIWAYYREHPDRAKHFDQCMVDFSAGIVAAVLKAYDFAGIKHLVDVGGGHGGVISAVLQKYPKLKGTLFDQPYVVEGARRTLELFGVAERCDRAGGNFFESVPAGGDGYVMKFILHDWDDERSLTILRNVRRAIAAPGGRLIVIDAVIPEGNGPDWGKLCDVNMLVMTGGVERTERQFKELFAKANFKLTRVVPTESPLSVIEAVPV